MSIKGLLCLCLSSGCLAWGCSSGTQICGLVACLGSPIAVALVDEQGSPIGAKGEIHYENHSDLPFDCEVVDCLRVEPVYNSDDTLEIRFQRVDGSVTAWQKVTLHLNSVTREDFNGPGCDCSYYDATAEPVTVPTDAQLPAG